MTKRMRQRSFKCFSLAKTSLMLSFSVLLISGVTGAESTKTVAGNYGDIGSIARKEARAGYARENRRFRLEEFPENYSVNNGKAAFKDSSGREVVLTLDPSLQAEAERLMVKYRPPYGALVALDPKTGAILSATGSSRHGVAGKSLVGRATFPAASLFKVVTGAAAVERARLTGDSLIAFRGGDHTLSEANYFPSLTLDRRRMTLSDAMGKSCNPVFARIALTSLSPRHLEEYARRFGFDTGLQCDFPIQQSYFESGHTDFEIARTAAGFQGAKISPIHAALVAAAVANGGDLLRPYLIDEVRSSNGEALYQAEPIKLGKAISSSTAKELMEMMRATTTTGTARRYFLNNSLFTTIPVAGKTGTLRGDSPQGMYHWFIGAAPAEKPEIAIATLVIDGTGRGGSSIRAAGLASQYLDTFFRKRLGLPAKKLPEIKQKSPQVRYAVRTKAANKKSAKSRKQA